MGRKKKSAIAVVNVYGNIDHAAAQQFLANLRALLDEVEIRSIVLRINSEGGSVAAAQEICEALTSLQQAGVRVVACLGEVAKSAAIYVACGANHVFALPGSVTGSIGAYMNFTSLLELGKNLGIVNRFFASGAFKDPNFIAHASDGEAVPAQEVVDDVSRQFCEWLKERRGMSDAAMDEVSDGRLLSGRRAKELGLVDEMGGFSRALTYACDHADDAQAQIIFLDADTPGLLDGIMEKLPFPLRFLIGKLAKSR